MAYTCDDKSSLISFPTKGIKGLTGNLILTSLACVIGTSFQFGYNMGVVNGPEEDIKRFLNVTHTLRTGQPMDSKTIVFMFSIIVSIWAIGGMIGGFLAGYMLELFGRRNTMLVNNILIVAGALMMSLCQQFNSHEMLIIGRLLMGLSCGVATAAAPVYLTEIAPLNLRGAIGSLHQLSIVFGILISWILGLPEILGSDTKWPYMFGVPLIPSLLQLLILPLCPESPSYIFLAKNDDESATKALFWLRAGAISVEYEFEEMRKEQQAQAGKEQVSILDLFKSRYFRQPLLIAIIMQLSQQLSGILGVLYYSTSIFEHTGLPHSVAMTCTLSLGVIFFAITFISVILVDRTGRRKLQLCGLGGMIISGIFITLGFSLHQYWSKSTYISVVAAVGFVIAFGLGPGSIPWFITAELFAQNARASAISIAIVVNWLANFVSGITFPNLEELDTRFIFVPSIILLIIFFIFTYYKVPETSGKTIDEISALFNQDEYQNLVETKPKIGTVTSPSQQSVTTESSY